MSILRIKKTRTRLKLLLLSQRKTSRQSECRYNLHRNLHGNQTNVSVSKPEKTGQNDCVHNLGISIRPPPSSRTTVNQRPSIPRLPSLPTLLMLTLVVSTQLLERRKYKTPLLLSFQRFCFDPDPTCLTAQVLTALPTSLKAKRPTGQGTDAIFFKASDKVKGCISPADSGPATSPLFNIATVASDLLSIRRRCCSSLTNP